jgi:hypothetical protein
MTMSNITTGEQGSITTTGAITGSLDTSGLSGKYAVKLRFKITAGVAVIALEDTANASAFSDAIQVGVVHIKGASPNEGTEHNWQDYEIPGTRFGATNTKLRFNVLSISGGGTLTAFGWLEQ